MGEPLLSKALISNGKIKAFLFARRDWGVSMSKPDQARGVKQYYNEGIPAMLGIKF